MADLTELEATLPVKIVGAGATGIESNYVDATANGLKVDGSAVTQPVSGTVNANIRDGAGNSLTSQVNGSQRALDIGINVAGVQVDPRQIRALTNADVVKAQLQDNAGTAITLGQKVMASSVPVVIASDQTTFPVSATQSGTWTVQQGTPPWTVTGNVASGATDSGNPVKTGGIFNTTQPTVTTGQRVDSQSTARGAAIVATGVDNFNINNISGTITLPTLAATSTKQSDGSQKAQIVDGANATAGPVQALSGTNYFPVVLAASATPGAAVVARSVQVAGSDGTNAQTLSTDATGKLNINNISGTVTLPTLAATSTKQSDGTQKAQVVDGSGNVQPSGDVLTRKIFVQPTDGSNNQSYTASGEAKVLVTALTNTSIVKAQLQDNAGNGLTSTIVGATRSLDNNTTQTVTPLDKAATGSLTALNSAVTLSINGIGSALFLLSGTWVGTVLAEGSLDGGVTWQNIALIPSGGTVTGAGVSANGQYRLITTSSFPQIRVRMSAYTSGTATVNLNSSSATGHVAPIQNNALNLLNYAWNADGLGNALTSQVNGAARALDIGINVAGVQVDPRTRTWTLSSGTDSTVAVGNVASGAADSGNPVKIGGIFNTTQPTVTNGQRVDAQSTARGAAIVATGTDSFNINNITGTITLPTLAATSTKQSDGTQKTQIVDGSGNVQPSGDVLTRKIFVQPTDGSNNQGYTASNEAKVLVTPLTNTSVVKAQLQDNAGTAITLGQKAMTASVPVVLSSDQAGINTFLDKSGTGSISALSGAVTVTTNGMSTIAFSAQGTFVATLQVQGQAGDAAWVTVIGYVPGSGNTATVLTGASMLVFPIGGFSQVRLIAIAYTSGTANIQYNLGAGTQGQQVFNLVPASLTGTMNLRDGSSNAITSTLINSKQRLDIDAASDGVTASAVPFQATYVGGKDIAGLLQPSPSNSIDASNSTTATLTSGSTYTGTFVDVTNFSNLSVIVFADQVSATDGLKFEYSTDGTNVDDNDLYTVPASNGQQISVPLTSKFYRIRYTNGGTNQGAFRLQSKLHANRPKPSSMRLGSGISQESDAEVVMNVNGRMPLVASAPATVSAGVASGTLIAANTARKGLVVINTSSLGTVSLNLVNGSAVLNSGITLYPHDVWYMDEWTFTTAQINVIASLAATAVAIQEMT